MNPVETKPKASRHVPPRREQVIVFSVASCRFAIAVDAVQEIRSTDSLAGAATEILQTSLKKVRHKIERNGKAYYVVHLGLHFGLPVTRPTLVLVLRKSRACALVDRIEEMLEISAVRPLPRAFSGEERRWYRGLALIGDSVIPVVHPSGFLTPEEMSLLDSAFATGQREEAAPEGVAAK
jgi:chemotaxis signal transduction protein